ncbi:DUF4367 domain-containing protein [Sedimentibacter hydroxybenzoicus DSM 7310]|uniref:DUF4367 domain-containing protein n=1 Tax=Sedimentibacter hydroxybenzoicus DSM 7310 TaxID=1123245 RepID=A0A974BM13_SEDHY|nr:DUF4367 domain-containing protein [Sedimentibacter hydroxybenzoicus]NYB75648.1 DUF4367 domain-containing protein [Sedimentibacter hydroxybenzoicus DSM 7310]
MRNITDEELDILLTEHMPKANKLLNQLEEERDKDITSHVFSESYKKRMKKIIKEYSRTPAQIKFAAFRKYAAAALIIFILANSFLIITVEAYRTRVFKIITTIYDTFTSIITETDDVPFNEAPEFTEPSYVPDGFEVINNINTGITRKIDYKNRERILVYKQSVLTSSELRIDTEGTEIKEIKIGNHIINYVFNKGMYNAYWFDNEYSYLITGEISFEELLKVIESVVQK